MKNRIIIIVMTVLLLVVGAYFGLEHIKEDHSVAFRVEITSDGHTEHIDYWQGGDGCIYVFLPGYVAFEDAVIDLKTTNDVYINQLLLEEGMSCAAFEKNCFYDFVYTSWGKTHNYQLKFVQSANVATMYIDTDSGNMDYIHRQRGNEEPGNMVLYTADGTLNYEGRIDAMKARGNDTWVSYEKKPYSVKLDAAADLLQMGEAEKWILIANACDPSNMNNKIVYDFAAKIGLAYSPDSEWVDLYLNNEYMGLYLLCERIEIGESRVDIAPTSEALDSSYIVSQELQEDLIAKENTYVLTGSGIALRIHEPLNVSGLQMDEIAMKFQAAERAICAEDGIDPQTGLHYENIIDVNSWVKKYLMEELFMSIDAGCKSQYYYYDSQSTDMKLYAGPVWDFDHSMAELDIMQPETLIANREYADSERYTPWFYELYRKEAFYNEVVSVYEEIILAELEYLQSVQLPAYVEHIRSSAYMNQCRWYMNTTENFDTATDDIYAFLDRREAFLNRLWIEEKEYCSVRVNTSGKGYYIYYMIPKGECIKELPEEQIADKNSFVGWYYEGMETAFDITEPIYEDVCIYAKYEIGK